MCEGWPLMECLKGVSWSRGPSKNPEIGNLSILEF
jgi:hypothetical protein